MVPTSKVARSGTYTAATLTDLYTNSSETKNAALKQLEVYNADVSAIAVEIYVTNGSNSAVRTLFNSTIAAGATIINDGLYFIEPGYKIRFKVTGSTSVQFEATLAEGMD